MSVSVSINTSRRICACAFALSCDPRRQVRFRHTHIRAQHHAPSLERHRAHQRQPGIPRICRGRQVQIHVLAVERVAQQRHVVLPADGGREREVHAADRGGDCTERGGRALAPDQTLGSCLRYISLDESNYNIYEMGRDVRADEMEWREAYRHDFPPLP